MLEIIKKQFDLAETLTKSGYGGLVNRGLWPKYFWDFYPQGESYFHELNPYFLFNFYKPEMYKFSRCITARDGYLTFAVYLLTNLKDFEKLKTGPIFIHPDLVPIVPPQLRQHFACWRIVQKNQVSLKDAKKILIYGLLSNENLGAPDDYLKKISELKGVHPDASVELFIPMKKDIFGANNRETMIFYNALSAIKDAIPHHKLRFLRNQDFLELTNLKNTYFFDLAHDNLIVSDNYVHYFAQTRGATVNNGSLLEAPDDSIFSLDLSIHHELHITPLPEVESIFSELFFYKRSNPTAKDLTFDVIFQSKLREMLRKKS